MKHRKDIIAWGLYDWANSAFSTLIMTFVFATYFTSSVMIDSVKAASLWSMAIGISGIFLLILSPIIGALTDRTHYLKRWIFLFMMVMILGLLMMDVVPKAPMIDVYRVLLGLIIATISFELGIIMVNSYLPILGDQSKQGFISSLGWGMGYVGGIVALACTLFGFIGLGDIKPIFELPRMEAEHIRIVLPFTALWMALFSIPFFVFVKSRHVQKTSVKYSIKDSLITPFKRAYHSMVDNKQWRNFMIGSALYRDGLSTLFAVGGIYAAARYGMSTEMILVFAIGINITGGIGCFISAYLEKFLKPMIIIKASLCGLILCGAFVLWAPTMTWFLATALVLGLFVGPLQSASRTMVSHLSKPETIGDSYGVYALMGRVAAFIGPFLFATLTAIFHSQTIGLSSVIMLWVLGYVLILRMKDTV
jgi:UMF1 family MFS transporter